MRHASLFSGIGGFDLAAEWMGWRNVFNCEWEDFPRKVLKHHFPNAIQYGDIRELDAIEHRGRIDILTGGFPCQPYSTAGKRLGKEDERHLWPEMLRIIREVQPRYVVGENVLGITSWNGGLVFDEVQADLENEGYEVTPYILPAASVNAPHKRYRVFFVAHFNECNDRRSTRKDERESQSEGIQEWNTVRKPIESGEVQRDAAYTNIEKRKRRSSASERERQATEQRRNGIQRAAARLGEIGDVADTKRDGLEHSAKREGVQESQGEARQRIAGHIEAESKIQNVSDANCASVESEPINRQGQGQFIGRSGDGVQNRWEEFPTQSPVCGGDDGLPAELDGITFSKWRNESIKAYGNAIVPQVALQIFKAIQETDRHD